MSDQGTAGNAARGAARSIKTKSVLALAAVLCLLGCAAESVTTGTTQLSRELADRSLIKGETTREQVRALLGDPESATSSDIDTGIPGAAAETWIYTKTFRRDPKEKGFVYGMTRNIATGSMYDRVEVSVLTVMFDARGRVSGHTFSTSSTGAKK